MEKSSPRPTSIRVHPGPGPHGAAGKTRRSLSRPKSDDGSRPAFPRLLDSEDVAARIAESWNGEFAARGGNRRDFAESARTRLRHWVASSEGGGLPISFEMRFRSDVARKVSARLDAWARRDAGSKAGS